MSKDRKLLHIINITTLAVLLLALALPGESSGRITAAVLLLPLAAITCVFIKKRGILSMNKGQVLMLLTVIGLVYLVLYYLTGLWFGFYKNIYIFNFDIILRFIIPISVVIVASEIIRGVIRSQENPTADVICYISCVISEALIYGNLYYITSFNRFMEFVGMTLFPAIIANLLYHYLAKRYGIYPNIAYRLITTLYIYIIPYLPAMADSLHAFLNLVFPILIYVFIDALYEKKRRYALERGSRLAVPLTVLAVSIMASVVMLISNQFRFGALVIATDSMTGELNKGDIVIFDQDEDQIFVEGQVIIFNKSDVSVVHRIVKIERINGVTRYYTKGDINEDIDQGYITDADIKGSVQAKLPYFGYPTLWLREFISSTISK